MSEQPKQEPSLQQSGLGCFGFVTFLALAYWVARLFASL